MSNKWTLAELKTEVAAFMNDTSYTRWSESDVERAINLAIRNAPPAWWEERIDDSHTYDMETFRYALPPACEAVEEVWFEPLDSSKPRKLVVPTSWHVEGNELVFTESYSKYDGQTLYMHYIVFPQHVTDIYGIDGKVGSDELDLLESASSSFITDGVRVGDSVLIEGAEFFVKEVSGETELYLHKEASESGTSLTFYIARYTDLPIMYILYFAAAMLYEAAARNRPGVEVDENLRLSSWYRQLATQELNRQRKARKPRRRY